MGSVRLRGAVVGLALLAALVVACTGEDQATSTTSTTPPDQDARGRVLDAPGLVELPAAPIDGSPVLVANVGEDLLVFGGLRQDRSGLDVPSDAGAILDAESFSWTTLPSPPFEFPTGYLQAALSDRHLVVTGFSCDPDSRPVGSSGPQCSVGPPQTARLDLDAGTWTVLPDPGRMSPSAGFPTLFSTTSGVLAAVESQRGVATWWMLGNEEREWSSAPPPPVTTPVTQSCGAGDTVAVLVTQTEINGGWSQTSVLGVGSGERYGRAVVSFWDDGTRSWTASSEVGVPSGSPAVLGGCVPGGYVLVVADGPDEGVWILRAGGASWERRSIPLEIQLDASWSGPPWSPAPLVDGSALAVGEFGAGRSFAYDATLDRWRPLDRSETEQPTPATMLGRTVVSTFGSPVLQVLPRG